MFESGSVRKFVLSTPSSFGELEYLKIWHDNSGKGANASWYLDHVIFADLQTNKR